MSTDINTMKSKGVSNEKFSKNCDYTSKSIRSVPAVCNHTIDKAQHYIRFDKPQVLAKENRFLPRMIREAIEIKKHPNFNREDGWVLPPAWDPIIESIKAKPKLNTARPMDTVSSFCVNRITND